MNKSVRDDSYRNYHVHILYFIRGYRLKFVLKLGGDIWESFQ